MSAVEHWRVDRFLKVQSMMKMAEQELERPLILLIAPGRPADQIWFAIAFDERWREGRARPRAWNQTRGQTLSKPEHLGSRSQRKAQFRDDGRALEPSAARRRCDHVAPAIHDVEMNRVAAMIWQFGERRARAGRPTRRRLVAPDYIGAADREDPDAQSKLGAMYANGWGVPQDYAQAVVWYRQAGERGNAAAQSNLGLMYEHGQGVPQDYVSAHMWLNLAGRLR